MGPTTATRQKEKDRTGNKYYGKDVLRNDSTVIKIRRGTGKILRVSFFLLRRLGDDSIHNIYMIVNGTVNGRIPDRETKSSHEETDQRQLKKKGAKKADLK